MGINYFQASLSTKQENLHIIMKSLRSEIVMYREVMSIWNDHYHMLYSIHQAAMMKGQPQLISAPLRVPHLVRLLALFLIFHGLRCV